MFGESLIIQRLLTGSQLSPGMNDRKPLKTGVIYKDSEYQPSSVLIASKL